MYSNLALAQFRALGGTVGLAQCGAVLNAKVKSYIIDVANSGQLSAAEIAQLLEALSSSASSLTSINSLPADIQQVVREAYRSGSRWSFISLIPWAGLSVLLTLFLSRIPDSDKQAGESAPQQTTGSDVELKAVKQADPQDSETEDKEAATLPEMQGVTSSALV